MKLLLVSALPPPEGGLAAWTEDFLEYCRARGVEVGLVNIALSGKRLKRINASPGIRDELSRTKRILRELKTKLDEIGPDIVHINTSCGPFGIFRDALISRKAKRSGARVLVHFHCSVRDRVGGRLRRTALKRMVGCADALLTLNSDSAGFVSGLCGKTPVTVPNFIRPELLLPKRKVNDTIKNALFVGHVQRSKGCAEIIEAARRLPDIRFTLVGPVGDDIAALEIPDNVVLTGAAEHSRIPDHMREADIFVFPSYSEGFSISLTEAMAAGLPCIATDVGANRETLGGCGVIIPARDAEALVGAVLSVRAPEIRQRMSDGGIDIVGQNYLVSSAAGRIFSEYDRLLEGDENACKEAG